MSTQTTTQVVYRGHDNRTELLITRYDGRRYVPVDFSAVTRMVLSMPDAQPDPYVFDTADVPGVIDWSGPTGSVLLNLQDYDVPAGVYVVSLVAYSPEWPNGYVVIDSRPSALGELTFVEFRTVIGSGVLPPPIPGPPAGAVEIRFNGVVVTELASSIDFTGSVEVEAADGGAVNVNVTGGGGGGQVDSVGAGTGIAVDASDPTAPVVALSTGAQTSLGKADTALQEDSLVTMLAMTSAKLLGRWTTGAGKVQEVTIGSGLNLSASGELTATGGGGGSSGVSSFNTRTGAVTLQGGDVTAALGYTPVNPSSL